MFFEEQGIWRSYIIFLDIINSQNPIVIVYDKRSKREYTEQLQKVHDSKEKIYTFDEILLKFKKILLNYPKERLEVVEVQSLLEEEWQSIIIKNSVSIFPYRFIRIFYRKKEPVNYLEGLEREQYFINIEYEMIFDIPGLLYFIDIFTRILN